MFIQQLSLFVENKPGRLAEITDIIAKAGVDIRALSIADTADYGILRLIVDRPADAERRLREAGLTVRLTEVIAVGVQDIPGEFAAACRLLSEAGVAIEYLYAFLSRERGRACVILRVDDPAKATGALTKGGIEILPPESIYTTEI
ncbi:MAG: ACT domain-containing protein [Oscillospiraceae bacterium]|nr:ACT domain-containing protein [Oscillospiraceae bacterium]